MPLGLVRAVEVDHQVMRGGLVGDAVVEVDSALVVALDEIDLESGDAPLFDRAETPAPSGSAVSR